MSRHMAVAGYIHPGPHEGGGLVHLQAPAGRSFESVATIWSDPRDRTLALDEAFFYLQHRIDEAQQEGEQT